MARLDWEILYAVYGVSETDVTSQVLSVNFTTGRQKYLDNYSGQSASITIKNDNNQAASYALNRNIVIQIQSTPGNYYYRQHFWIQEITFNDYPGNTGLSTATITAVDWISRSGRMQAVSKSLTQTDTTSQLEQFNWNVGGPLTEDMYFEADPGTSIASSQTYTGTVGNQLNLLSVTERSQVWCLQNAIGIIPRSYPIDASTISFGRTVSSSQISYQDFVRVQNGTNFVNTVTVSPNGLATQTATNSSSVTTYGTSFYSSATVDYTTTQALGNAQWVANTFSDPTDLRFEIVFTDLSQNETPILTFLYEFYMKQYVLNYQTQGQSATSENVRVEGFNVNITPEQTTFTVYFSPANYYQYFILNSTTLGILDTSRLGW